MAASSRTLFEDASEASPQTDSRIPRSGNSIIKMVMDRLRTSAKATSKTKAALWLADLGDLSPAQSYRVMTGEQNFSGPVICHLLRSQDGYRFLKAIMDGTDVQWWRDIDYGQRLADVQKRKAALKREEKMLENE